MSRRSRSFELGTSIAAIVILAVLILALMLLVYGVIWWLWCAVLTYFWPTGPQQVINPDFWPFVGL